MASSRHYSKEVFVPLSHPPGHAQFDFGEATVVIAGVEAKAALAVMTLPYSDAYFVSAYPRECTETFQAGHVAAFEFFGGVPVRTSYDNTSIAVKKVVGRERELTSEFLRLESHFLFGHHFCRVGRGNEKGHVETHRRLLEAEPAGPGAALLLLRRAERVPRRALLCRPVPPGPRQARDKGRASRRRPGRHVGAAGRVLRGAPGRAAPGELALARAIRPQRLLGADRLRPPRASPSSAGSKTVRDPQRHRGGGHPSAALGQRARQLRPRPLPGPLGAQARRPRLRPTARGLGAARVLRDPAPAPRGRPRALGAPASSSRCCGCWSTPRSPALTGAVDQALAIGATGSDAIA